MSDHLGLVPVTDEICTPREYEAARMIGEELVKHYPRYPWVVRVDMAQGIAQVSLNYPIDRTRIKRGTPAFVIPIKDLASDMGWDDVMRAGGELLERYGLRRGRAPSDHRAVHRAHGVITEH